MLSFSFLLLFSGPRGVEPLEACLSLLLGQAKRLFLSRTNHDLFTILYILNSAALQFNSLYNLSNKVVQDLVMSEISLILVLQIKTSKFFNDMAKVSKKSEIINAFDGIFFVLDKFDSILSSVIGLQLLREQLHPQFR